jgi:hypothetical protein
MALSALPLLVYSGGSKSSRKEGRRGRPSGLGQVKQFKIPEEVPARRVLGLIVEGMYSRVLEGYPAIWSQSAPALIARGPS